MSSDLVLDESQQALRDLAADLFAKRVDPSTIEKVESTGDRFDRDLWSGLADAGLLGVAVPEGDGGLGFGALELALVLEQFGRVVAPVPLGTCALAAWCVATHGDDAVRRDWLPRLVDGSAVMVVAPPPSLTSVRHDGDKLSASQSGCRGRTSPTRSCCRPTTVSCSSTPPGPVWCHSVRRRPHAKADSP